MGNIAINDSFLVESHIYVMIRKHFRNQPFYADLLDLFHETTYQTELGQLLDLTSLRPGQLDFTSYTIERYNLIVKLRQTCYFCRFRFLTLVAGTRRPFTPSTCPCAWRCCCTTAS